MDTTLTKVLKIVQEHVEEGVEVMDTTVISSLELDSLRAIEMIWAIEEEVGVEIPVTKISDMDYMTISEFAEYAEKVRQDGSPRDVLQQG